jgi:hypothetical protein
MKLRPSGEVRSPHTPTTRSFTVSLKISDEGIHTNSHASCQRFYRRYRDERLIAGMSARRGTEEQERLAAGNEDTEEVAAATSETAPPRALTFRLLLVTPKRW